MESNYQQGDHLDLLWGAKEIAQFLRLNERQTRYQIDLGLIPVKRQGRLISASKSVLRQHFATPDATASPPPVTAAPDRALPGATSVPAE
jgi:hypothetical protein